MWKEDRARVLSILSILNILANLKSRQVGEQLRYSPLDYYVRDLVRNWFSERKLIERNLK